MKEGGEMKRGILIGDEQEMVWGGETGIEENRSQMLLRYRGCDRLVEAT